MPVLQTKSSYARFRSASGFATQILAYMLDSLVRVSRRVVQGQIMANARCHRSPKPHIATNVTSRLSRPLRQPPTPTTQNTSTTSSRRTWLSMNPALSRDRFPFNNFTCYLTPFSRCFSSFPHGTCSLSVSCQYLAFDGIYHPFELHSQATRLVDTLVLRAPRTQTGLSPSVVLHSRRLVPASHSATVS